MVLNYKKTDAMLDITDRKLHHVAPHLHGVLEMVYVTEGTLEIGVGTELYHMEEGDFAVVFPDLIHHYQVFSEGTNRGYYVQAANSMCAAFSETISKWCPVNPVIKKDMICKEAQNAIMELVHLPNDETIMAQAYIQIILAKCIPLFELIQKDEVGQDDLVYQTVAYISSHFREEVTLGMMAEDIGVSKYVLSRIFSKTFHRNFNQYLNDERLNYAIMCLEHSDLSITQICMDSGFDSQRTFNRVFKERYKVAPREYRKGRTE